MIHCITCLMLSEVERKLFSVPDYSRILLARSFPLPCHRSFFRLSSYLFPLNSSSPTGVEPDQRPQASATSSKHHYRLLGVWETKAFCHMDEGKNRGHCRGAAQRYGSGSDGVQHSSWFPMERDEPVVPQSRGSDVRRRGKLHVSSPQRGGAQRDAKRDDRGVMWVKNLMQLLSAWHICWRHDTHPNFLS